MSSLADAQLHCNNAYAKQHDFGAFSSRIAEVVAPRLCQSCIKNRVEMRDQAETLIAGSTTDSPPQLTFSEKFRRIFHTRRDAATG
jgi:hypothetical protein